MSGGNRLVDGMQRISQAALLAFLLKKWYEIGKDTQGQNL